ncbi:MAG: ABC transporter permease [Pseudomonadota bacterium]
MSSRMTIARWEFFRFFKWKSELIGLLVTALLFSAGFLVKPLMEWVRSTDRQVLEISDNLPSPEAFGQLSLAVETFADETYEDRVDALAAGEIHGLARWNPQRQETELMVMREPGWLAEFEAAAAGQALPGRLAESPADEAELGRLLAPSETVLSYHPDARPPGGKLQKLLGIAAIALPMIGVFTAFSYFFVSITAEKQNRLGEQLLSAVGESQWLDGKLIGLTALCIKSMLTMALLGVVGISVYLKLTGKDIDAGYINWLNCAWAFAYSFLAVAFWSAFMAAVATTINDPNSSSRSSIMLLPGLFMLLPVLALDLPDSLGVAVLSIVPVTSTAFMPIRLVLSEVPFWQLLLSVALMVVSIAAMRLAARRILKLSILMYGREPSFSELWKAVKLS